MTMEEDLWYSSLHCWTCCASAVTIRLTSPCGAPVSVTQASVVVPPCISS